MPERSGKARQPLAIPVTIQSDKHLPVPKEAVHTHVVPDALYGIKYLIDGEKRYRFFALECENTTSKRRSTAKLSSVALKRIVFEHQALLESNLQGLSKAAPGLACIASIAPC